MSKYKKKEPASLDDIVSRKAKTPVNLALARSMQRSTIKNGALEGPVKFTFLEPEEYIRQGYQPQSAFWCLNELRTRGVSHGVEDGRFWFDRTRLCLTPGLIASCLFRTTELIELFEEEMF